MITITIDGRAGCGKTLLSMRIAKMLQDEGVDVTVLTEPSGTDVNEMFYENPIPDITERKFQCVIHDTNKSRYDPNYHDMYSFRGK